MDGRLLLVLSMMGVDWGVSTGGEEDVTMLGVLTATGEAAGGGLCTELVVKGLDSVLPFSFAFPFSSLEKRGASSSSSLSDISTF